MPTVSQIEPVEAVGPAASLGSLEEGVEIPSALPVTRGDQKTCPREELTQARFWIVVVPGIEELRRLVHSNHEHEVFDAGHRCSQGLCHPGIEALVVDGHARAG